MRHSEITSNNNNNNNDNNNDKKREREKTRILRGGQSIFVFKYFLWFLVVPVSM